MNEPAWSILSEKITLTNRSWKNEMITTPMKTEFIFDSTLSLLNLAPVYSTTEKGKPNIASEARSRIKRMLLDFRFEAT